MADNEIQINVKGPSELKLQITISTDNTVSELKQAIAEKSDVAADRQRLIYSGRVLKDDDKLSTYKIQTSHTIHMVKGAAASSSTAHQTSPSSQPLPSMQAGQSPLDPLTQLNSHQAFGALNGFDPFANMGVNPTDPNMMQAMLDSPEFISQMSSVMSNPAILDQLMSLNPQLSAVAPQVRDLFHNERFRAMMSNPETLRAMIQMSSLMRDTGGPFGGMGGGSSAFPAPGVPSTGTTTTSTTNPASPTSQSQVPPLNPFGFFPPPQLGQMGTGAGTGAGAGAVPNSFNPALFQQMQSAFGAPPSAPTDSRPPEERFQVQLQQLQDMGFTIASQNVRALLATGGNVHAAIEYILGGGGL